MSHKVILDSASGFVDVVLDGKTIQVDAVTEFLKIQELLKNRESMGVAANDYVVDHIMEKYGIQVSRGLASQYVQVLSAAVAELKKSSPTLQELPTTTILTPGKLPSNSDLDFSSVSPDSLQKASSEINPSPTPAESTT